MADPTPELKTYYGNCHCAAFKFHIKVPEITSLIDCNCSICFRHGYKWLFPGEGCFIIEKGEGTLKSYEFGPKSMAHQFCPTCGTGVLGKRHGVPAGQDIGINAATLRDIDLWSLKSNTYDGKATVPAFVPRPALAGPQPTAEIENAKTYTGTCHCGNATITLKTKGPLSEGHEYIQECNCSICTSNGTMLIYPQTDQVTIHASQPLTSYSFGRRFQSHEFCPICGVAVYIRKFSVSPEDWAKSSKKDQKEWEKVVPVNLKCLEDVEWNEVEVKRFGGKEI